MISSATHTISGDFEKLYIQLRKKEGRVYTDEEVATLPEIAETHPHYSEWQIRKQSCQKLISYLQKKQSTASNEQTLKILEVGCGNGWLSHHLAAIPGSKVIGTDINFTELRQAAKVFHNIPNLHFIYSHIESGVFEETQFDVIVFAASIQYFSSLTEIIRNSLRLLKPDGEIHIIDSHFYSLSELSAAKQRSILYYQAAGFPEMANWYFHHCLDDLEQYNYSILYDPGSLFNRFLRNKNPFPWILIQP
jgi:ubiquinone/menaquinone biosynthesis C-methylase UbiE